MTDAEHVKRLSTAAIVAMENAPPDVAIMALLDAGVRILGAYTGMSVPAACAHLAEVARKVGDAERGTVSH